MRTSLAFVAVLLFACGDDSPSPTADAPTAGADAPTSGPDAGGLAWTTIITDDWQLEAGAEITSQTSSIVLDREIYVGAIRPIAPVGTHHTVLALDNIGAGNIIYASGVGTNEIVFPPGVGLRLPAGQSLVLQLHVFNTDDAAISGTSGIEIVEVAAADVQYEADLFLPGPLNFSIPPMQETTLAGDCMVQQNQTIFAVFPHMHQLGTHLKTTINVGGTAMVIHNGPYSFIDQAFIPFTPIAMSPGDTVTTECTWNNTTAAAVGWGESSTTEMCFSILYRYPAADGPEFCF